MFKRNTAFFRPPSSSNFRTVEKARSRAANKLLEIDSKCKIFQQLRDYKNNNNDSSSCVAIDIGAAPGGMSQILAKEFSSNLNRINKQNDDDDGNVAVIAIDNRLFPSRIPHVTLIQGSIEERRTVKRVNELLVANNNNKNNQRRKQLCVVTNDTVAIVRSTHERNHRNNNNRTNQISVTYAQNNLLMCAMRRSVDWFIKSEQNYFITRDTSSSTSTPPYFFISKILRSIHKNQIIDVASTIFDKVEVLKLDSSKQDSVEEYLVAQRDSSCSTQTNISNNNSNNLRRRIPFSKLSLPPQQGEAREWTCWSCFQLNSGSDLKCSRCS